MLSLIARAFRLRAPSCLCSRLTIFRILSCFVIFAEVGWKRLALFGRLRLLGWLLTTPRVQLLGFTGFLLPAILVEGQVSFSSDRVIEQNVSAAGQSFFSRSCARVSQPSSVVSNKSHISLMLPTLRRMLARHQHQKRPWMSFTI